MKWSTIYHRLIAGMTFYGRAKTIYDIHSPYVYELIQFVDDRSRIYYNYGKLADIGRRYALNQSVLVGDDYGAGSLGDQTKTISSIYKNAVSSNEDLEWLFRLLLYLKPKNILELGTSLGLSSLYMSLALPDSKITSIEGHAGIHNFAVEKAKRMGIKNVDYLLETFDSFFDRMPSLDFDLIVVDGNHTEAATLKYYELIKEKSTATTIVFDDINWSKGMTTAWEKIRKDDAYNIKLEFFNYGLLINYPQLKEQLDIAVIPYSYKLWRFGLFS